MDGCMGNSAHDAFQNRSQYDAPYTGPYVFPNQHDTHAQADGSMGGLPDPMYQQQHMNPDGSVSSVMDTLFSSNTTSPGSYGSAYNFPGASSQQTVATSHEGAGQFDVTTGAQYTQPMPPLYQPGSFHDSRPGPWAAVNTYHHMPMTPPLDAANGPFQDVDSDEPAPNPPAEENNLPMAISPGPGPRSARRGSHTSRPTTAGSTASSQRAPCSPWSIMSPYSDEAEGWSPEQDFQRAKILRRNRVAASKCREKKKVQADDLERTATQLQSHKDVLETVTIQLRDQIVGLKAELLEHVDCGCTYINKFLDRELDRVTNDGDGGGTKKKRLGRPCCNSRRSRRDEEGSRREDEEGARPESRDGE